MVQVLVAEKAWIGGSGFAVTDEMKVTVAGQAALLVLGMDEPYYFDGVQSIIFYEGPYEHPGSLHSWYGIFAEGRPGLRRGVVPGADRPFVARDPLRRP